MIQPSIPSNEAERLMELESFSILDTMEEEDYDNLTTIASEICQTPISLVSLVDHKRQWFKSRHGLDVSETPKELAFCAHAINNPYQIFVVPDSRIDERFHDNPLVTGDPHVIFYAGVPLVTEGGHALGTLCVIDKEPRTLTKAQEETLTALAKQVVNLMQLRKKEGQLEEALEDLKGKNEELERFAFTAAHDINSPLKNIMTLSRLYVDKFASDDQAEARSIVEMIGDSSQKLRNLVEGMLQYSKNSEWLKEQKSTINVEELGSYLRQMFAAESSLRIEWNTDLTEVETNKTALYQILINLVANAINHNDKDEVVVEIGLSKNNKHYLWYVQDNGPGLPPSAELDIFEIFATAPTDKNKDQKGNGIGLATVKKLVESLEGEISAGSDNGQGARFNFSLAV